MLKLFGCCLIAAGTVGEAFLLKREVAEHLRLLFGFRQLFAQLLEEIRYTRAPMEQLLLAEGSFRDERIATLCRELGETLARGDSVSAKEEWRQAFLRRKREFRLSREELEVLMEVGDAFFGKCMEENESYFTLAMNRFDFLLEELSRGQKEKQKVMQSVVLMGGAMLVLMLI